MVSAVTLGTFFSANGKTVLGGVGGSGLDTQSLLKALTDAKNIPAVLDQDQIAVNNKQSSALNTFATLLSTFQTTVDALRNPPGVNNAVDNVFRYTSGSVASDTAIAGSTYLSVTTEPGAALQAYTIRDINSLATAAHQGSGTFTIASADTAGVVAASSTPGLFTAGTVTINGEDITLTTGDTLNTIASKFNAVSENTGISASIIRIDSTHYQLSFVATATGEDGNFDLTDGGTVTAGAAVLANIGLTAAVEGTNARFKINGVDIERQSNNIDDVVEGITFTLKQLTPDADTTHITVTVEPDRQTAQNIIVNFVKAYNAIKTFAAQQTQLNSDGTYAATAILANNQSFRAIMADINTQVTAQVQGITGSNPGSLSDIGITFANQAATDTLPAVSNILNVNDSKLASALATNFNGVSNLFGFHFHSDNPNLTVFSRTNALATTAFTLTITPPGVFTATYAGSGGPVPLTATVLPGTGYTLTGQAGTALEGLVMIYSGTDPATINVTATQGLADKAYNISAAAMKQNTGLLAIELKNLQDSNTRLNKDIEQVTLQVELYRQQLLIRFGALEQAISRVNNLLQSMNAQSNAQLAAAGG